MRPLPREHRTSGDDTVDDDQELTAQPSSRRWSCSWPSLRGCGRQRPAGAARATYAEELGIDVAKGLPSVLFRLLVASILFSSRIGAD